MVSMALDRIFSFSTTPIRLATYTGILLGLFSFALSTLLIIRKVFLEGVVPGWTATSVIMLTSTGINLVFLGVIGEYLSRVYQKQKSDRSILSSVEKLSFPKKQNKILLLKLYRQIINVRPKG